jgi:hypothetical protein
VAPGSHCSRAGGQFPMTLDTAVMNVSIATVAEDVHTTMTGTAITLYTLVIAALIPPHRPARFLALLAGIVVMPAELDAGAGPEIVTWPILLSGLGVGRSPRSSKHHGVVRPRRAERRGRRPAEHAHEPRCVDRHGAGGRGADLPLTTSFQGANRRAPFLHVCPGAVRADRRAVHVPDTDPAAGSGARDLNASTAASSVGKKWSGSSRPISS